jgi:hypothetical protein
LLLTDVILLYVLYLRRLCVIYLIRSNEITRKPQMAYV